MLFYKVIFCVVVCDMCGYLNSYTHVDFKNIFYTHVVIYLSHSIHSI